MTTSTLFQNGTVIDGSGAAARPGSVLIEDNQIKAVLPPEATPPDGVEVINCQGHVIAPGFIDMHSHMDYFAAGSDPSSFDSFTRQGITGFVAGNCGFSPCGFKKDSPHLHLIENGLFKEGVDKINWSGYAEFMQRPLLQDMPQTFVNLIGHGTCRTSFSGFEARDLSPEEFADMLAHLEQGMDEGAAGVSLGLQYKPGIFADMEELKAVARVVKKRDKLLTVHARAYSSYSGTYTIPPWGKAHNIQAIEDMIALARETGVKLQFSHLIFVGTSTWKTVDKALTLIDKARADGVDIMFDIFPYTCGATLLNTFLPDWFMAKMPKALDSALPLMRLRLEALIGFNLVGFGFGDMQITKANSPEYEQYNGMFIPDIAKAVGKSPFMTMIDLLKTSNMECRALNHGYYTDNIIDRLLSHPAAIYATDAWPEPGGVQNPAAYGSFPRILDIARTSNRLTLEMAVHKMTGAAADRANIEKRGYLREGYHADITVFDPATIRDNTKDGASDASPDGVRDVYSNGIPLLRDGELVTATSAVTAAE